MGLSLPGSGISIGAGAAAVQQSPQSIAGTNYTMKNSDTILQIGATAAFALTGPPAPPTGWEYTIIDALGNASVYNITFTPQNDVTVNGQTSAVINTNRGTLIVYYDGTEFKIKASRG